MAEKTIVLITGANTGLGLEMVKALYSSSKAYDILLAGRSLEKATTAANSALESLSSSSAGGSSITPLRVDIESDESIENLFKEVQSRFGRLDVLINNAGMHPAICTCHQKEPYR